MNERQQIARDNHCRFAFETSQQKFQRVTLDGASSILTVNSGYE